MAASYGGYPLLSVSYVRDALRRIVSRTEVQGIDTIIHGYAYDETGRLTEVSEDGVVVEAYAYDANGNRVGVTGPGGVITATHDALDRLLTLGTTSFTYTAVGELAAKIQGSDNGVLDRGWLYQDARSPVAELDGSGAVVTRFVYGIRRACAGLHGAWGRDVPARVG